MKISIFSGGTGAVALKRGLLALNKNIEIINFVNGDDNGKSTGVCSKLMRTLGPSDFRKNLSTLYKCKTNYNRNIVEFLDGRVDIPREGLFEFVVNYLDELNLRYIIEPALLRQFVDAFEAADWITDEDLKSFNVANIVFSVMFKVKGVYETLEYFAQLMQIDAKFAIPWTDYNPIIGITALTKCLEEYEIVDWNNAEDKIVDVTFTNGHEYDLDESILHHLDESEIIILSAGTQWSSLIPSYKHRKMRECLQRNKHKTVLVMNNTQDKDMIDVDADEIIDILSKYIDIDDMKVLSNQNADVGMVCKHPRVKNYVDTMKNDDGLHDADLLASAIIRCRYDLRDVRLVFDFDDTLYARSTDLVETSHHNIKLASRLDECIILSGHKHQNIQTKIAGVLGVGFLQDSNFDIYSAYGMVRHNKDVRCITSPECAMTDGRLEQIKLFAKEYDLSYEVRMFDDKPLYVSIREVHPGLRKLIRDFLRTKLDDQLDIRIAGKASIDIIHKDVDKLNALRSIVDNQDFIYFGDEVSQNDQSIYEAYPNNFVAVSDVIQMNVILRVLINA